MKFDTQKIKTELKQKGQRIRSWLSETETGRQSVFFLLIPLFLIIFYLIVLAPDRYVSTASVVIKESGVAKIQTGLLEGLGINAGGATVDEQLLRAYIVSPNLLNILEEQLKIKEHYSNSWDFVFGLSSWDSQEDFLKFYRKYVTVGPDAETGLLTITVQGYTPEFTKALADILLKHSEKFINEVSQDVAKREMQFALDEIERSQGLLKEAKNALLEFQNQHNLVSPESEGESLINIVFQLEGELAQTEATIKQNETYLNASAPQIVALKSKAEALRREIEVQKQRVTGSKEDKQKLNELTAQFQELNLDLELATTLYTSALNAYELARVQAVKQLKHLIVASKPQFPQEATYPKRVYWAITWLVILSALWGIVRMIIASSREHKD